MLMLFCFCFFFKQKTAYEMRISDWSSDVCSSDLLNASAAPNAATVKNFFMLRCPFRLLFLAPPGRSQLLHFLSDRERACIKISMGCTPKAERRLYVQEHSAKYSGYRCPSLMRSEEHTSELQSLMRISYAVFCLKTIN